MLNNCSLSNGEVGSSNKTNIANNQSQRSDNNKIKVLLKDQSQKMIDLEDQIEVLNKTVDKQKQIIDEISKEISNDKIDSDIVKSFIKIKNKVKILEDKAFYSDSLYFELLNDIVQVEDSINRMSGKSEGSKENHDITNEEYTAKYIEFLSLYQRGELSKSMGGFIELLGINSFHDLSDNCQYWIGEIYYSQKKYEAAAIEFLKVFDFQGTNKADDSYYKLGLCYMNLERKDEALNSFNKLLNIYPNSEYRDRAQEQIKYIGRG